MRITRRGCVDLRRRHRRPGALEELAAFDKFLARLPHPHKIVVAGNRDNFFERRPEESLRLLTHAVYLQDREISIDGLRIFGSPWQPTFMNTAFNLPREKWALLPIGIDILVTHTPPLGIGDSTETGKWVGCADLLDAVRCIRPRLHVFGHVHEEYGLVHSEGMTFVNASVMGAAMELRHPAFVMDL